MGPNTDLGTGVCHQDYLRRETVSNLKAVLYSQFNSEEAMLSTLTVVKPSYYAAGKSDGTITTFYLMSDRYAQELLGPLRKFGFVINSGPQYAADDRAAQAQSPSTHRAAPIPAPLPAPAPVSTVTPDGDLQWRFQSRTANIACDRLAYVWTMFRKRLGLPDRAHVSSSARRSPPRAVEVRCRRLR